MDAKFNKTCHEDGRPCRCTEAGRFVCTIRGNVYEAKDPLLKQFQEGDVHLLPTHVPFPEEDESESQAVDAFLALEMRDEAAEAFGPTLRDLYILADDMGLELEVTVRPKSLLYVP